MSDLTSSDSSSTQTKTLPIEVLMSPFVNFAKMEAASGILLMVSTIAALVWANSPWAESYHTIWTTKVTIGFGQFALTESRHEWINDGLMAVFFFLVGLEIKREVLIGELSSLRQAAFPLIAALGGAILPALFYLLVAHNGDAQKGWAIPMATDVAFVLGVLAILGTCPRLESWPLRWRLGYVQASFLSAKADRVFPARIQLQRPFPERDFQR